MVRARLERKPSQNPYDGWWLEINGTVPPETFQLAPAIENNTILQRVIQAASNELIIDFSSLKEFDSRGLQLLLMLYRQFSAQNIQIVLYNPHPYLIRVLRIMQVDRVFKVEMDKSAQLNGSGRYCCQCNSCYTNCCQRARRTSSHPDAGGIPEH